MRKILVKALQDGGENDDASQRPDGLLLINKQMKLLGIVGAFLIKIHKFLVIRQSLLPLYLTHGKTDGRGRDYL